MQNNTAPNKKQEKQEKTVTAQEVLPAEQLPDEASFGIPTPAPQPERKPGLVVVTGASTGIGWETVKTLRAAGWPVIATARRAERLAGLAKLTGCYAFSADLSDENQVTQLRDYAATKGKVQAVVNNAGGALGMDPVAQAQPQRWQAMFERNVLATLHVTKAFLPTLQQNGGDLVFITSIAAIETYPGGGGYTAAKHAERMLPATLRLELVGQPVRIIEIQPGLVQTPEFSLTRLENEESAQKVYDVVTQPLAAVDVAQTILFALSRPAHVNLDQIMIKPVEQANSALKKPFTHN